MIFCVKSFVSSTILLYSDASYYAVAVVKNSGNEDLDILKLLDEDEVGRFKSCHTGVGKTSGWNTPIGWIARQMNLTEIDGRIKLYGKFKIIILSISFICTTADYFFSRIRPVSFKLCSRSKQSVIHGQVTEAP